jgi:hypothetical protein
MSHAVRGRSRDNVLAADGPSPFKLSVVDGGGLPKLVVSDGHGRQRL